MGRKTEILEGIKCSRDILFKFPGGKGEESFQFLLL